MSTVKNMAIRVPAKVTGPSVRADWSGTPLRGFLPLVVALGAWQIFGDKESPYFPPPSEWVAAIVPLVKGNLLLPALGWTTLTFVLGLLIATVVGAIVGTLVGSNRFADRALGPTLEFLRILPAASLVPLAALILGYTMEMKLAVVVLPAIWPILLTCRTARRSMSPVRLDVPRTLGLSRWEGLRKVTIPSLVRPVLLGVRVSAPLALIITLLVEIVTRVNGLGGLMGSAQSNYFSAQVYGLLMIAGALGFATNWLVTKLEAVVAARLGGKAN
ncbi:ABC transporter permease subunit [Cryobacterium sp. Hh7]|uniref:ABC transporter permease n=1 Tax=Cryobacterium sp. Hh7 TaxID=1259159 RepID=UPI00106B0E8E|nr:ABC transporter permease subunit [Cryobacterium sp. Hh7]TFD56967.1 ABC transporter permease subunit [Cryobacterium sp. Hh7]